MISYTSYNLLTEISGVETLSITDCIVDINHETGKIYKQTITESGKTCKHFDHRYQSCSDQVNQVLRTFVIYY